jgi:hypothetical protein
MQRFVVRCAIGGIGAPAPFAEPRVPDDGQQPRARIVAVKAFKEPKCTQVGILHDIVRIACAAAQPARQVIGRVQMR